MTAAVRVLAISTLFPSPARPAFGPFVAHSLAAVMARGDVDLTIINPIGIPPWPLSLRAPYADWNRNPARSDFHGAPVHHPRFATIPLIGADSNPRRMAHAILPLVRRLHGARAFDVIDAQFCFPDGPAAMRIAAALGLPFTMVARGSDIHFWGQRPKARRQILDAAQSSSGMLAVSGALKADMVTMGMPVAKIATHYTGLDHARFFPRPRAEARAALDMAIPADAPLLLCTGALIAIKGQALAIAALAEVPGAHLVLAGTGPDEAELRALAGRMGLAERVHFAGQVSHEALPVLASAADAMVLPSQREGLANAWVEALACGTPLVIPDIGGAREVVTGPDAGRIAARAPAAIAEALRALLANPPSQTAVAAYAARFSWAENAARLVAHWNALTRR